ncbi:hypothetical protein GCG54_00014024, partial [Colletotrichum gloeosporioides]
MSFEHVDVQLSSHETKFPRPVSLLMIRCTQRDLMNAKHPFGKVPILEDIDADGNITKFAMWHDTECKAISRWLAVKYASEGTALLPNFEDYKAIAQFEEAACPDSSYLAASSITYLKQKVVQPYVAQSVLLQLQKEDFDLRV